MRLAFEFRKPLQEGRRRRPLLLPALRAQRSRRAGLHPAAHVRAHRRTPSGARAVHAAAGATGRHHPRRRTGRGVRLQDAARPRVRGNARPVASPTPDADLTDGCLDDNDDEELPPVDDPRRHRGPDRHARARRRRFDARARGLRREPEAGAPAGGARRHARQGRGRLGHGRGAGVRIAGPRGHAGAVGGPGHAARERSANATACSATRPTSGSTCRWRTCPTTRRAFMLYDTVLSEYAALRFRVRVLDQLRRAGVLGSAVRRLRQRRARPSSTSSSPPPPTSGASAAAWPCSSPTASRDRVPSTPAHASSGTSRSPPRGTCVSCTPPPQRSTSTCFAARRCRPTTCPSCASRRSATCACPTPVRRAPAFTAVPSRPCSTTATRPTPSTA